MKLNHKQKIRLARSMLRHREIINHTPIFLSENWEKRKQAVKKRLCKRKDSKSILLTIPIVEVTKPIESKLIKLLRNVWQKVSSFCVKKFISLKKYLQIILA